MFSTDRSVDPTHYEQKELFRQTRRGKDEEMGEVLVTPSKQAILDAAQKLLAQHGYAGLSMRDLANECGLAKATIYHYFRDKEEIFLSVLERDMEYVHDRVVAAAQQAPDPILKLRAALYAHFGLMRERRSLILTVLREIGGLHVQLHEIMCKQRERHLGPIVAILEEGIAQGIFRPMNVELATLSLLGMLNNSVAQLLFLEEADIGDAIVEHTLDLFLHGVVK